MTVTSILVPTDFSPTSEAAVRYAGQLALTFGARLHLLHVPGRTGEHMEADYPIEQFRAPVARLESFFAANELDRLRPTYAIRVGTPAEEIAVYADSLGIDLIVMGTHGRTGIAHTVMGSVAEHVVRIAPCPVLLVRSPKRATVAEAPVVLEQPVHAHRGLVIERSSTGPDL
jgi:nucleotide-binding universal stress UspA family protein